MYKQFKNRHKTSHLSKEENAELMRRYYDGENVKQLIEEYAIDTSPSGLVSTFQLVKNSEKICIYCKSEMYYLAPSRSAQYKKEYLCKSCLHIEGKYNCECKSCVTHKQDEANKKRLLNKKKAKENNTRENPILQDSAIPVEDLSLKERIYLGALLRSSPFDKNKFFTLNRKFRTTFAPTVPFANNVLTTLIDRGVIFEVSSNETSIKFAINLKDMHIDENILVALMYPEKIGTVEKELLEIIRDIQAYESVEYFDIMATKFNLPSFTQGEIEENFLLLFKQILNSGYSTAQLFNFIYSSIRNVAARNNCSMQNTNSFNEIYTALSNRYDKAVNENWNIKNYNRIYSQNVSELFKLVGNDLLGLREAMFYEPLRIHADSN